MEGSSLPSSNASVFGVEVRGWRAKAQRWMVGPTLLLTWPPWSTVAPEEGYAAFIVRMCVGCRSRACGERHSSSQSSHLLPLSPPATDHSNFSGFSLDFGFRNLHFLVTSQFIQGWFWGESQKPVGSSCWHGWWNPPQGPFPACPPDPESIILTDLPSTLLSVLFGIFLCHWPEGILSHIWDSQSWESQGLKSLWEAFSERRTEVSKHSPDVRAGIPVPLLTTQVPQTHYLPRLSLVSLTIKSWKVVAEPWKMPGFLASRGEDFNLGPVMRLDHAELLCDKVLLKYKRDRESFWHRHQKGAERVFPC